MENLDALLNILFLPLYIFVVLTLHELGHYIAARFFNISVDSFSLGYGDKLWGWKDRRGTEWIVRLFPICGHVHLAAQKNQAKGTLFFEAPPWQRAAVISAGPITNIITGFLFLFTFFALFGLPSKHAVLAGVETSGAAYEAGLQTGDRIIEVEGNIVRDYREVWKHTYYKPGVPLHIKFMHNDHFYETVLTPRLSEYTNAAGIKRSHGLIGILVGRVFLDMRVIASVNGIKVGEDEVDKARSLLIQNFGKEVVLGIKWLDGKQQTFKTVIDPENNAHLLNPAHKGYGSFFAGPLKDNFYLQLDTTYSLIEAGKQMGRLIKAVATIPFQLFPVDKEMIQPWALVSDESMFARRKFYEFCYRVALVSVIIALLNLIPFPGTDGSMLLLTLLQGKKGKENEVGTKRYKYVLLASLFTLYGAIMVTNMDDFAPYMHKKMMEIGVVKH